MTIHANADVHTNEAQDPTATTRRWRRPLATVALTALCGLVASPAPNTARADSPGDQTIYKRHSMIVTNVNVLNQLTFDDWGMGYLLGEVGQWNQTTERQTPTITPGKWVSDAFQLAVMEQDDHDDGLWPERSFTGRDYLTDDDGVTYVERTLADPVPAGRRMDSVFRVWDSRREIASWTNVDTFRDSPFRLLAVVNRLDLAGDFDARLTNEATETPRTLGELHLVYGLIDSDYESANGDEPFPMTFELSYRVPALAGVGNCQSFESDDWDHYISSDGCSTNDPSTGNDLWRSQMAAWAEKWQDLSEETMSHDGVYYDQLTDILGLVAQPENFLSMRSNTRITDGPDAEHELREWYVLQGLNTGREKQLVPRKPRNEPFKCLDGSEVLRSLVRYYWDEDERDLDMSTRDASLDSSGIHDLDRAGYNIARDQLRDSERDEDDQLLLPHVSADHLLWEGDCAQLTDEGHYSVPFQMIERVAQASSEDWRRLLVAPVARVKPATHEWRMLNIVNEDRRHAFAIRTCSGCHSQEGASSGFHIAPRPEDRPSELSPFMTGGRYSNDRRTYRYDRLDTRADLLRNYLDQTANLFDGLYLAEQPDPN